MDESFGLWSEGLASSWAPNPSRQKATTLNLLYEAMLMGVYLPLPGFFYFRFGARTTFASGAIMMALGYCLILFQFWGPSSPSEPNWFSVMSFFIAGHATGYIDTAAVSSNMVNFGISERGAAMGILKGYFGLSASVFALVKSTNISTAEFLVTLGPLSGAVILFFSMKSVTALVAPTKSEAGARFKLNYGLGVLLFLAVLMFVRSLAGIKSVTASAVFLALVLVLMSSMFCLEWVEALHRAICGTGSEIVTNEAEDTGSLGENVGVNNTTPNCDEAFNDCEEDIPVLGEGSRRTERRSLELGQALCSLNFWLLFLQLFFLTGAGLTIISNAALIMKAKGGDDSDTNALVSLVSVANCFGRIAAGSAADSPALAARGIFAPTLLAAALLNMAIANAVFIVSGVSGTLLGGILAGLSYGAAWTLYPVILGDICGLGAFSKILSMMGLAPTLGSLVFSNLLASIVFQAHATTDEHGVNSCTGSSCFRTTHLILSCCCAFFALIAGPVLARKMHKGYLESKTPL